MPCWALPQEHLPQREGDPAQTLYGRPAGADLLVVRAHGHGGFGQPALGSVSATCANNSRCPVVIVPDESAILGGA